ncbi:MAG: lactate utilization protein [Desulfuromonas sp.]|nr:MAG: lactate utilization protein [Desulfuromonas sp.]
MHEATRLNRFKMAAEVTGAQVVTAVTTDAALDYISERLAGALLLPNIAAARTHRLADGLRERGCSVIDRALRKHAAEAEAGLTCADFAIAETGTLVLESTAEDVRLASTLPPKHFVIFSPQALVDDALDAVPLLRRFQQRTPASYLAYITGPSRTADIERVLTIGVHGPKELHILLCDELTCGEDS